MSGETKFDPHKLDLGQLKTLRAAAPDMYEALEKMVDHFGVLEDNPMLHEVARSATKSARQALAKARGEPQ